MFWLSWQWRFSFTNFHLQHFLRLDIFLAGKKLKFPKIGFISENGMHLDLADQDILGCSAYNVIPGHEKSWVATSQDGPSQWQQHRMGQAAITLSGFGYQRSWEFDVLGYLLYTKKTSISTTWLQKTLHIFVGLLVSSLTHLRHYKSHTFVSAQ